MAVAEIAAGCVVAKSQPPGAIPETPAQKVTRTATEMPTLAPTPTPVIADAETPPPDLTGFAYPIEGACLPENDDLMPGAPRPYRNGTHEGVDFYDADNCTFMGLDTEILAAKAGTVVRADTDYEELTPEELVELERGALYTPDDPDVLDAFRGRQVWVDDGDGVVTRYCHLDRIAEDLDVGMTVEQGEIVGYMGESGAPESITDPGTQVHLHFELRVGDSYLGQGLPPDEVRQLYEAVFSGS